jgi:transposase
MSRRAQDCRPIESEVLVVGVDVGKRKLVGRAVSGDGRSGKPCRFGCEAAGFEALAGYAEAWRKRLGARGYVVAMEASGHYGEPLAAWLRARGITVYAVQPLKTRRAKELYDGTWRKTDEKDALVVADLCRRGLGRRWRVLKGPFAALRVLTRRREQLVQRRRRLVNRLHRHRDVLFPELGALFPKLLGRASRWVLRHLATPAAVLEMGVERLSAELYRASRWQLGRERAEAMLAVASRSVGVADAAAAHELAIVQLLDELEEVVRQLAEVERRMQAELERVDYAGQLKTVPGFGTIMVATLLGEFGDLRDYRVARQLIKMAGLDLVEASSGERQGHRHISRRGRRYARQMLYMAALTAGRLALSERRRRLVEEKHKPAPKAVIANACALLRISHALVRDGVPFDGVRHAAPGEVAMAA